MRVLLVLLFSLCLAVASLATGNDPKALTAALAAARGEARGPAYFALVDYYRTRDPEQAVRYAEQALTEKDLAAESRARILAELSYAEATRGRYPEALRAGIEAQSLARELGQEAVLERALNNIGSVYFHLGQWQSALSYYQQALRLAEKLGDKPAMIGRLNNIGNIYAELKQFDASLAHFRLALPEAKRLKLKLSFTTANIGIALSKMGRYTESLPALESALADARRDLSYLEEVIIREHLANSKAGLGQLAEARALLGEAKRIAEAHQLNYKLPALYHVAGKLELEAKNPAAAAREAEQGLALVWKLGRKADERRMLELLAQSLKAQGRDGEAVGAYERYLQASEEHFSRNLTENIALLQVSFASERKEHEIALLKRDNALKASLLERAQAQRRLSWLILGGSLLLAVLVLLGLLMKYKLGRERRLNEELRRLAEFKDQLLAKTSHELLTPLNGIIGLTELALDEEGASLSAPVRERLGLVLECGRRLSNLVNDMLEHALLRAGQLRCQPVPVPLHEAARQALLLVIPAATAKGLQLHNRIAPELPRLLTDPERLQQILHNLLHNAVKYTGSGYVELSAHLQGEHIVIGVSDTGPGIAAEDQARIFESYEQVDNSTSRTYGGAGLGLALCQQLVELQGGSIGVRSEPGQGSLFWFSLPVVTGSS